MHGSKQWLIFVYSYRPTKHYTCTELSKNGRLIFLSSEKPKRIPWAKNFGQHESTWTSVRQEIYELKHWALNTWKMKIWPFICRLDHENRSTRTMKVLKQNIFAIAMKAADLNILTPLKWSSRWQPRVRLLCRLPGEASLEKDDLHCRNVEIQIAK